MSSCVDADFQHVLVQFLVIGIKTIPKNQNKQSDEKQHKEKDFICLGRLLLVCSNGETKEKLEHLRQERIFLCTALERRQYVGRQRLLLVLSSNTNAMV